MDSLLDFRNPSADALSDVPHPLGWESDEAIGRRYNRGTGVLLEGGPFASHPIVNVYEASDLHHLRCQGNRSRSTRTNLPSIAAEPNVLNHAQRLPRAAHGRTADDFRQRGTVRMFIVRPTKPTKSSSFRDVGLQLIFCRSIRLLMKPKPNGELESSPA